LCAEALAGEARADARAARSRRGDYTSYANQVENGKKVPTLTVILKLARALEMTPSDLLTDFTMAAVKRFRFDE
jgi:transcriptional regulator with XRE-family HTH domain